MYKFKRMGVLLVALTLLLSILSCFSLTYAADIQQTDFSEPTVYAQSILQTDVTEPSLSARPAIWSAYDKMRSYLSDQFVMGNTRIDLTAYAIPYSQENAKALYNYIWFYMPESFHVYSLACGYYDNGDIVSLIVGYQYSVTEYAEMLYKMEQNADKLLEGIVDNNRLSDVEKALLLHDRLALWCEYDPYYLETQTITWQAAIAYGALVARQAVCQGYAQAYAYLLEKVGIDSYVVSSTQLNHAWNIVYINGAAYHTDVTWDDAAWDIVGNVSHYSFLRSSRAFYYGVNGNGAHAATDYDTTPVSTVYDNAYWTTVSTSAFVLLNNKMYYIDPAAQVIKCTDGTTLGSVSSVWSAGGGSNWVGNFARLSTDGKDLLYSTSGGVYKYVLATGRSEEIYAPVLAQSYGIYGFTYEDGYLICDISTSPLADAATKDKQLRYYYDTTSPTVSMYMTTNGAATAHQIGFDFGDDSGVVGYYWGKSSNYSENAYYTVSGNTVQMVADVGTYYAVAMDAYGNLSAPQTISFYKIDLHIDADNVIDRTLLAESGSLCTLPVPQSEGRYFCGWAKSSDAASGDYAVVSNANTTYYAVWQAESAHLSHNYTLKNPIASLQVTAANCTAPATYYYSCACGQQETQSFEYGSSLGGHIYTNDYDAYCNYCGNQRNVVYPADASVIFADVNVENWYYKNMSVNFAYNMGLFQGTSATLFSPQNAMTRGMFVTVLGRLHGAEVGAYYTKFTDVKFTKYYAPYIKWASDNGIVNGTGETTFSPDSNVTREQICTMMVRYCDFADIELRQISAAITFNDADKISNYAKNAVATCQQAGLVNGKGNALFDPKGNAKRAEVATIMMNFCKNYL